VTGEDGIGRREQGEGSGDQGTGSISRELACLFLKVLVCR